MLEGLRRSLADAVAAADIPVFTASFGLTDASQADTLEGLLRIADAGLYAAKQRGRDRVIVGDAKQAADIARAGQMAGAVADAVAQPRPAIHAAAEEDEPRPSGVEIR